MQRIPCTILILVSMTCSWGCNDRATPNGFNRKIVNKSLVSSESDWPNLHGPNHQSHIYDSRIRSTWDSPPKELWRIEVGSGYSSPVLSHDRLFISHRKNDLEIIECFSSTDGRSLWSHSFPASYKCPYQYSSGPYSTPVLFDDKIIVVGQGGNTVCLLQESGNVVWQRNLFDDYDLEIEEWPVAASGIVLDDLFVFNLGANKKNAGVVALDINTGFTVWECNDHAAGHATPNILERDGKPSIVMVTIEGLVSLDPIGGKQEWFIPFRRKKAETYNAVSPVVGDNMICMVTGPGPGTLVVDVDSSRKPKTRWQDRRILDSQYTNLLCIEGLLFGFTSMKQGGPELRCIDLKKKQLCWKWKAKLGRGMMAAANDMILVVGEKGHLCGVRLSSDKPQELFRTSQPLLQAPCYSAPAIYDAKLYLRNEKQVVCLDLAKPS